MQEQEVKFKIVNASEADYSLLWLLKQRGTAVTWTFGPNHRLPYVSVLNVTKKLFLSNIFKGMKVEGNDIE